MAACQPSNQPPQRTRRSHAHTFRISQIPIAQCAAFSAPHPPRVLSLAAFGHRPLVYVVPMSLAGIRNPQHKRTHASQQTTKIYSITSYSFDVRFGKVNELKDGQLVLQRNVFVEAQGFAFERMDTFEACI